MFFSHMLIPYRYLKVKQEENHVHFSNGLKMNDLTRQIRNAIETTLRSGMFLQDRNIVVVIRDNFHQTVYSTTAFDEPFDRELGNAVHITGKPVISVEKTGTDEEHPSRLTIYFPVRIDGETGGVGMIGIPLSNNGHVGHKSRHATTGDTMDSPAMTGTPSFMKASLQKEIVKSDWIGQPTTVVMMNVDNFSKMNEEWGHHTGDMVLSEFCQLIRKQLRSSDLFGKWSDREFMLLLPETDLLTGNRIAKRIRIAIEHRQFSTVGQISASLGTVTHSRHETVEDFVRRIEAAVFIAKTSGKNRVELKARHFMKLVWKHEYECGNAIIDEQHRLLLAYSNQLLNAIFDNLPKETISGLIHQLLNHVQQHFDDEENILSTLGYVQTEEHAEIHRQLVEKAVGLAERFEQNKLDFAEIFSFLANDVVIEHMQNEDMKFFPFLAETGH